MTLKEFYPIYLQKHSKLGTKIMHVIGLVLGYAVALSAVLIGPTYWYLLAAPMIGYFFAFSGHKWIEHNTPATFGNPLLSLICDHKMVFDLLTGKL